MSDSPIQSVGSSTSSGIESVAGGAPSQASQPDQTAVGNSAASAASDGITQIADGVTFSPLGEGLRTQTSTDSAEPDDGGTGGMQPANADGPPGPPPPNG